MSPPVQPWPPALAGAPAAAVIEGAIERRRLGHSLLLHGDDQDLLVAAAQAIADRLLHPAEGPEAARPRFAGGTHPDRFELRPSGKMRQIPADAVRGLISKLQVTPAVGPAKVAILHEADRMNPAAANIFLKTLEEPPPRTVLLLLTTRPYALLSTLRSRCLHFRFPSPARAVGAAGWAEWLDDYGSWMRSLAERPAGQKGAADPIFTLYGLVARFGAILAQAAGEAWNKQKESLPPTLEDDERIALEAGATQGLRWHLFAEIERATRDFAVSRLGGGDDSARPALIAAVSCLEKQARLFRYNLNESTALEHFLLASLRIWAKRG